MSGIGGHVNRADRARRRDHALVDRIRHRYGQPHDDAEALAAFAEALGTPLDPWQRALVEAYLDPRTTAVVAPRRRSSWHATGHAIDMPQPGPEECPADPGCGILGHPEHDTRPCGVLIGAAPCQCRGVVQRDD